MTHLYVYSMTSWIRHVRFDQPSKDMTRFDQPPKQVERLDYPPKKVERFD